MLDENEIFSENAAKTFFVQKKLLLATNVNLYLDLRLENDAVIKKIENHNDKKISKLIFYINCFTGI